MEALTPRRGVCLAILCAAILLALLFLAAEGPLLLEHSQREYGEGHVLWLAQQIFDPGKAYGPIDHPPFVVFPYPPVYMLVSRLLNAVLGDLLLAGRLVSLLSAFGIGIVVALTVLYSTPTRAPLLWRWAAAAFGGVLPLVADSLVRWSPLMRVDMLAVFLMYAGLFVYIAKGRRERWQWLAAVLFVLALYTKQTTLSAPLACLTYGLFADRRRTIRVALGAAALTLLIALGLNSVTGGWFLTHILAYNINPFSWKRVCLEIYHHMRASTPLIVTALAAIAAMWNPAAVRRFGWARLLKMRCSRPYGRGIVLSGLNFALATVLLVSIGKMGATYNHLILWDVSACLLCGLFLFRLLAAWPSYRPRPRAAALVSTLLLASLLLPANVLIGTFLESTLLRRALPGESEVLGLMRQTPGLVYSENLMLSTQAGKEMVSEPSTITMLAQVGRWDEQPYLDLFKKQRLGLLVVYDLQFRERYSPAVADAIERAYSLERRIGPYSIYRPRRHTSPVSSSGAGMVP